VKVPPMSIAILNLLSDPGTIRAPTGLLTS
jgi:hypothetical protein